MKTIFCTLSGVLLLAFAVSCSRDDFAPSAETTPDFAADAATPFPLATIGEYHNQKLDEFYYEVEAKLNQVGCNAIKSSHIRNAFNSVVVNEITGSQAGQLKNIGSQMYEQGISSPSLSEYRGWQLSQIMASPALSSQFKAFYSSFHAQVGNVTCVSEKDMLCNNCRVVANVNLTGFEKELAIAAIDVFSSSYQYWSANLGRWKALNARCGASPVVVNGTPQSLAGADMGGIVAGGAVGAVVGGVGSIGVFSGPAWVVGAITGGVGASIGSLVGDFWDWLTGH